MIKNELTPTRSRWLRVGFACMSLLILAACHQTEVPLQSTRSVKADSTASMDADPPVKPGGPGGGS